ncbi:bifunctional folylpolyglutamate synthase/dihydrofolate synthase [Prochlorococcus marinus]|uniref:Putuative bifunctional Dihydrofolate/Folylpolyglutamate synthase n=1 Tax=Prochlorococcus marinus (strain MIT 9303) TaxID=59922 RepID=A2CB67_PROM3|nr:Mur ligase family protein [Prochlorococcus marinus]ABM78727.1 putuative bifunctional Dihydrofolate/Folylpolyglutamate synthase [Prochlorococcus marinus str. MIT 9303]
MAKPTSPSKEDLSDLIPRFDQRGMDLGLERMQQALQAMGNPCASIPAIQVVGTNGKGSIASFIASSLKAAGIRVGLTTSPHLVSWCERISSDGELISIVELRQRLTALQALAQTHRLTPFELLMATAFDHFRSREVELLVLEVGLGGRLDATTAHPCRPIIAMANIGLDHCEHLGYSLKEITAEKSAVISPGAAVISARQQAEVASILEDKAKHQQARLQWVSPLPDDWTLGLPGVLQRQNAAVAKGALESLVPLGWRLNEDVIRTGLAHAYWPARLQTVHWQSQPVLIDGAHNPPATERLAHERQQWSNQEFGVCWVLGLQAHKQAPAMLRHLLKPSDLAWIVPVPEHCSWTQHQLAAHCPDLSSQLQSADNVEQVFSILLKQNRWPNPPPVVAGSLYLLGDLLAKQTIKAE